MSFIDDVVSFGKKAFGFVSGDSIGGSLARTALIGFGLRKAQNWLNKENEEPEARTRSLGVREQVDPNTDYSVPVVYGNAYLGGVVTDARLVNSNQTMWYCIAISEKTGVKLSDGVDSQISFKTIYWNTSRMVFKSNGITAEALVDEDGNRSSDISGLVNVYLYNNGSDSPANLLGYSGTSANAYDLFPGWSSSTHQMNNLVFALIRVDYNETKRITGLGRMEFEIENSLKLPGDVLNDYLQNDRYGCGIQPQEIASE